MVSTKEAAQRLGISETRVRTLLGNGQLDGEKIGRTWVVSEASVERRRKSSVHAGRPRKRHSEVQTDARAGASSEERSCHAEVAHELYLACKANLSGVFRFDALDETESAEEERFYIAVANFFLQEKQRMLVEQGVF
ncbi:MAG: helix-turn-helix domain-containing protein [Eggerthellaceae bacterium]|nr:helix-turn-helix domain-containing protein [Eggerthellaceae bacterium]